MILANIFIFLFTVYLNDALYTGSSISDRSVHAKMEATANFLSLATTKKKVLSEIIIFVYPALDLIFSISL